MDNQLTQIMNDVDKDLEGIMPQIAERMKRRVHLAYLLGVQDAIEKPVESTPYQLPLALTTE